MLTSNELQSDSNNSNAPEDRDAESTRLNSISSDGDDLDASFSEQKKFSEYLAEKNNEMRKLIKLLERLLGDTARTETGIVNMSSGRKFISLYNELRRKIDLVT